MSHLARQLFGALGGDEWTEPVRVDSGQTHTIKSTWSSTPGLSSPITLPPDTATERYSDPQWVFVSQSAPYYVWTIWQIFDEWGDMALNATQTGNWQAQNTEWVASLVPPSPYTDTSVTQYRRKVPIVNKSGWQYMKLYGRTYDSYNQAMAYYNNTPGPYTGSTGNALVMYLKSKRKPLLGESAEGWRIVRQYGFQTVTIRKTYERRRRKKYYDYAYKATYLKSVLK